MGYCANGGAQQVFSSSAWALADSSVGQQAVGSDIYLGWVGEAWQNCLTKNPDTIYVSVWDDAGYRCYTGSCQPNGDGRTKSFAPVQAKCPAESNLVSPAAALPNGSAPMPKQHLVQESELWRLSRS